jgi:hypothetical protein
LVSDYIFSNLNEENFQKSFSILSTIVSIGGMRKCVVLEIFKHFDSLIQTIASKTVPFMQSFIKF